MPAAERSARYPLAYGLAPTQIGGVPVVNAANAAVTSELSSEERDACVSSAETPFVLRKINLGDTTPNNSENPHAMATSISHGPMRLRSVPTDTLWVRIGDTLWVWLKKGDAPSDPSELRDAMHDLDEAREEAREEGFSAPSDVALRNARLLLPAMYDISPRRFEVYPMPDGEVAIDAPGGQGRSALLLCESGGSVLCLVNMHGAHRHEHYSDASMLPDSFVREAMEELDRRSDRPG